MSGILNRVNPLLRKASNKIKYGFSLLCTAFRNRERKTLLALLAAVSVLGMVFTFAFSGARIAYRVNYQGKDVALVKNKETVESAIKTVAKIVKSNNVESAVAEPQYTPVVALNSSINTQGEVISAIIENTTDIVEAGFICVDGKSRIASDAETLNEEVNKYLHQYDIEGAICSSKFVGNVEVTKGYFLKHDLSTAQEVAAVLTELEVETTVERIEEVIVPYTTREVKTADLEAGTRRVSTEGVSGTKRVVSKTVYINGKQSGDTTVLSEVGTPATEEVVLVGTALPRVAANLISTVGGFTFPLPSGTWNVSSYFGDGRAHKGMDFSASTGTPIMAVAAGTVTRSEWYYGYGYCVEIDHGNGVSSLYGHASQLLASVGQRVSAGDVVALVGNTGDSSGSHLHLEIKVGGTRVNPAPYLGF